METINQRINQCRSPCSQQRQPGARGVWGCNELLRATARSDGTEWEGRERAKLGPNLHRFQQWCTAALQTAKEPHQASAVGMGRVGGISQRGATAKELRMEPLYGGSHALTLAFC